VQTNPVLLKLSLSGRMRPRFFLALQMGVLGRCKVATCMQPTDAKFLTHTLRGTPAASWSVEQYKQYIASSEFALYMDSQEAAALWATSAKYAAKVAAAG
jgi:hypothetical protein